MGNNQSEGQAFTRIGPGGAAGGAEGALGAVPGDARRDERSADGISLNLGPNAPRSDMYAMGAGPGGTMGNVLSLSNCVHRCSPSCRRFFFSRSPDAGALALCV
jgi:hypothetical protein